MLGFRGPNEARAGIVRDDGGEEGADAGDGGGEGVRVHLWLGLAEEGVPLGELHGVGGELVTEADWPFRREGQIVAGEGAGDGRLEDAEVEGEMAGQGPEVEVVLQSAVGHAQFDGGGEFFRDDGVLRIDFDARSFPAKQYRVFGDFGLRIDTVAEADVEQERQSRLPDAGMELHSEALVTACSEDLHYCVIGETCENADMFLKTIMQPSDGKPRYCWPIEESVFISWRVFPYQECCLDEWH